MSSSASINILDDDTPAFGEENNAQRFRHPYVVFFHLAFRTSAVLVYLFCGWFSDSFVTSFVLAVILLSLDFWTVKNVTGRLLVGLRWTNDIDNEGKSHWKFEKRKEGDIRKIYASESRIFWIGLIVFPVVWILLFIIAIFRFSFRWLVLDCIALSLNTANVYGYLRCRSGQEGSGIQGAVSDFANKLIFNKFKSDMIGRFSAPPQSNSVI